MRVARLIIYEGEDGAVLSQLGRSMPDGVRDLRGQPTGVAITVATLPPAFFAILATAVAEALPIDVIRGTDGEYQTQTINGKD